MTLNGILAVMKTYIRSSLPQWQRDVDIWIKNDTEGFHQFKVKVFFIINSSKKKSQKDGFEIINPKC